MRYRTTIYPRSYEIGLSAEDGNGRVSSATYSVRLEAGFEVRRPDADWAELDDGALVVEDDSVRVRVTAPRYVASSDLGLLLDGNEVLVRAEATGDVIEDRAREWTLTSLESVGKQGMRNLGLAVLQPDGSTYQIGKEIQTEEAYGIETLYNVPNPFSDGTWIFYGLGASADEVTVRIFTSSGKRIRTLREFNVPPHAAEDVAYTIHWDGTDADGDPVGNGLYFYKIFVRNAQGVVNKIEKMVRVR